MSREPSDSQHGHRPHLSPARSLVEAAEEAAKEKLCQANAERAVLASIKAGALIEEKRIEGNLVDLSAKGPSSLLGRYRRFWDRQRLKAARPNKCDL